MKIRLFSKYNRTDSLLVISGYPKRGEKYSQGVCAVSSFAKNTLLELKSQFPDRRIIVLTMKTGKIEEVYEENEALVIRCFERNNPLSYISLVKYLLKFNKVRGVLLEFEFASFGNTLMTSLLAPLAWVMTLLGKNVYIVAHQVVSDIKTLSGHIGVPQNSKTIKILDYCFKIFYVALTLPAKKVIVLEEEFRNRLGRLTNPKKIVVIPHGVDTNISLVEKNRAKKLLGINKNEFTILYFGYLGWYKGVDFLIESLGNTKKIEGKKIKLVIAGGPSFTQKDKPHYKKFITKLNKVVSKAKNTVVTGFVDEKDFDRIFSAADLVVFPYRTFMSSSGPVSLAISYKKPFIISENMRPLFDTPDMQSSFGGLSINSQEMVFKPNKKSLIKAIKFSLHAKNRTEMVEFSRRLKQRRSFANLAISYNEALSENKNKRKVSSLTPLLSGRFQN